MLLITDARKWRHREVKGDAQITQQEWQSQSWNLEVLAACMLSSRVRTMVGGPE
jgi:hypothetical protein